MSKFNVGDKVRFTNGKLHKEIPNHYPEIGTTGIIKLVGSSNNSCLIQWPKGTTSVNDCWWVSVGHIERVESGYTDMTNEEIWEMLKPKMEKNSLADCYDEDIIYLVSQFMRKPKFYYEADVHNAIAIAYRSGYERAMRGRSFKLGEKKEKKGGHWEPVDPNNLPKEGTKIRYTRHIDDTGVEPFSEWTGIQIGEETFVRYVGKEFFVKDIHNRYPGSGSVCSSVHPERFDMWVEDNE